MAPRITVEAFMRFLILFTINDVVTAFEQNNSLLTMNKSVAEQLKNHEDFFDFIKNSSVSYTYNGKNELTSLTCINRQKSGLKECTAAVLNTNQMNKASKWSQLCTFSLDLSNYEAKESNIDAGPSDGIIVTTLIKSKTDDKVFIDLVYTNFSIPEKFYYKAIYDCENLLQYRIEVGKSMWDNNQKPFVNVWDTGFVEIFYEGSEGSKIYRTFFSEFEKPEVLEAFYGYFWEEIVELYMDPNQMIICLIKHLGFTCYERQFDYEKHEDV